MSERKIIDYPDESNRIAKEIQDQIKAYSMAHEYYLKFKKQFEHRKVTDYYICRDPSAMEVREEVMGLISDGWELLGGISVTFDEEKSFYAQGMVKYEK